MVCGKEFSERPRRMWSGRIQTTRKDRLAPSHCVVLFVPRRNPKTRSLINYTIGFADEHSESGALHYGMCIANDCVQRKTYQHVRIFWKDYTTHKSTNAVIDFDSDNWGGGDILVGNRRISGNLKKGRPTWWDSVRPAFVLMLLHDHSFCCCPDSFDVGAIKHYWAGSRPTWWY